MIPFTKRDYDAVVVGSGPNGLAAAITLQQQGLSVLVVEAKATIGGGMRSAALTLPGFVHDVCSAIHPLAVSAPFFKKLPLQKFGLEFINPLYAAAHPFDDGSAAVLHPSIQQTADSLGIDGSAYKDLMQPLLDDAEKIFPFILGPLRLPRHPLAMAKFGVKALQPAAFLANKTFTSGRAKALFAGMAAHAMVPLTKPATAAIALVLMLSAHNSHWPMPKGGAQQIAAALAAYFVSLGGTIETNFPVTSMRQLPTARSILFDVSPRQLLQIAGHRFSSLYRWQLNNFRYGMGVYKMDWALSQPVPFLNSQCLKAGTVHLGSTAAEIARSERLAWQGKHAEKPFVLLAQQSVFDGSRAPDGQHTAWAYCHVPNGSVHNSSAAIAAQIERFAPGFKDCILAKNEMNSEDMEAYNPNYIGGDINGGAQLISQLFTRPALRLSPYRTAAKGLYLCSSSTPPGGGVHGMCGYHAARVALRDVFNIRID